MEVLRQLLGYPLFQVGEGTLPIAYPHPCLYAGNGNTTFTDPFGTA